MLNLKRLLGLGGITSLLGAAAFAVPAQAELKGECTVVGDAKTVDKEDPQLGVRLVGGEGKFVFRSLLIICLADSNKDGIPEAATSVHVTAAGWYDNTVCGTGKALGTITSVISSNPKYQVLVGEEFAVQFLKFKGVFKWHDWDKPDVPAPKVPDVSDDAPGKEDESEDYTPAGTVVLGLPLEKPPVVPPPPSACGKAFSVTGSVLIDFDH